MKQFIVLFVLLFSGMILNAQKIKVIDKQTAQPVEKARITGATSGKTTETGMTGEADLTGFDASEVLVIERPGYHILQATIIFVQANNSTVYLSERAYTIDEVVVSASKFEEKRSDIPQQTQVISARSMQFANQPNMAEVMQNSGNVLVQKSQGGGGSPIIRGFEASRVLMVVDGVRMNNAIYRAGHLQNILTLDNTMLDRTEIVFGPGSVIYGSDALGGVMHFYTKNPRLSDPSGDRPLIQANLLSRYSSAFDEKTGHFDVNIGYKKVAFLTSFTFSDFGDLRQGNLRSPFNPAFGRRDFYVQRYNGADSAFVNKDYNVQVGSEYRQYDLMQKVLFRQNDEVSHLLNVQYSTSSDIPRYDRLVLTRPNGQPRYGDWHYGPQDRLLTSYTLNLDNSNPFYDRARAVIAYQDIKESRHDRNFGSAALNNRKEHVGVISANLDFEKQRGIREFRYGAEFTHNDVTSAAYTENIETGARGPLDTRYASGGASMQTAALYATESAEFSRKLIATAGIRLSYVGLKASFSDKTFFPFPFTDIRQDNTAVCGTLGIVYEPGSDWRIAALVANGFKAPNVDDLSKVFESVPGNLIVPNPGLEPEKTYNAELSVSKVFDQKVRVEGIVWYTRYKDALTVRPATFNGSDSIDYGGVRSRVTMPVNAQEAYLYGASGNISADITNAFSIVSTVNYTFGRIKTDTADYPLDHIPPVFGQTSFNLSVKKFRGEFFVRYNGWKRLKDFNQAGEDNLGQATPVGMPAWCTLNLRMSYQVNRIFQVQGALENISDQNYRVFASGISAPGRNLVISMRARF
jgi:hemoglobin/transferrin/lactoferrin receptor protein